MTDLRPMTTFLICVGKQAVTTIEEWYWLPNELCQPWWNHTPKPSPTRDAVYRSPFFEFHDRERAISPSVIGAAGRESKRRNRDLIYTIGTGTAAVGAPFGFLNL